MRVFASLIVFFTIAGLTGPRAWGDARSDAKAKLVEGSALLKQGEFQQALARFEAAYQLVPNPKIRFNFGLAYRGMGRYAEALDAFERFLAEATDAPKDARQQAEKAKAELLPQVALMDVSSPEVPDAEVFIDGKSHGPVQTGSLYLDPGPHQISVEKPAAGLAHSERVSAKAGERLTVTARPARAPAPTVAPPVAAVTHGDSPAELSIRPVGPGRDKAPPPRWQIVAAWGAAAGAVGALGFGVAEWLRANDKFTQYNAKVTADACTSTEDPACKPLHDAGESARGLQVVGLVAAGVLGATSALLFYLAPPKAERSAVALACVPSTWPAGAACGVSW